MEIPVRWTIEAQGLSGEGILLDASRGGAQLRMSSEFDVTRGATFTLSSTLVPLLPCSGKLRWFRRLSGEPAGYLCGLIFLELGTNLENWGGWLNERRGLGSLRKAV